MPKSKRTAPRPSVFVGSSVEGLPVAYAIQENLSHDGEVTVWPQGVFDLSKSTIQSLAEQLGKSDFGIFVFTPNDRTRLRGKTSSTVRDNVVFELGLFAGRLDIERTFIVLPDDGKDLHIPTDLTGVTPGKYDANRSDGNLAAALGPFCNQVRRAIQKLGGRAPQRRLKARRTKRTVPLRHITIYSALYGSGPHRVDVKKSLLKELRARRTAFVGNQLGGDPTPNVVKDLQLDFSYRGERKQVIIPEGGLLAFPA